MNKKNIIIYLAIIGSAVLTRLVPHAWNFAPVTAIAIFAAIYLPKKQAFALPLAARFLSDLVIGFFGLQMMIAVYLSHLFGVVMGLWVRKNKNAARVLAAPVISAVVFFLVTNFAFLYSSYPHTWEGIVLAYTNGLPFLRGTLLGDLFYTVALVGSYELVRKFSETTLQNPSQI